VLQVQVVKAERLHRDNAADKETRHRIDLEMSSSEMENERSPERGDESLLRLISMMIEACHLLSLES
jgi:hypothetical protein